MANKPIILVSKDIFFTIGSYEEIKDIDNNFSGIELQNCILVKDKRLEVANNLHQTEKNYPEMTLRFREITDEMYKVFLDKNNDYSRWNILATGIVGITTRFWDKTARIMNLVGFNIGTGEYTGPKINMVEDERIEQTFLDASVYGIIARIYIEGKWGK